MFGCSGQVSVHADETLEEGHAVSAQTAHTEPRCLAADVSHLLSFLIFHPIFASNQNLVARFCLQLVSVTQGEPFRKCATGKLDSVCAESVSPGPAASPAVAGTVIRSLPVNFVRTASSLWTPSEGTSASLWTSFPSDCRLFPEAAGISGASGRAFRSLRPASPRSGSPYPDRPRLSHSWKMLCSCSTNWGEERLK